ncbi:lysine biosynthesis enzyme LysX [Pyrolobus fumarii 1A]|uniref:Lysine biosynthesis enzyme LysX n=1 Tax=Pyrolobus fumarii (strain DSM 11204 / 1A) TaxID=694429 RepID=G0EDE0_PYRF1|nr:lysine biosynthesis protein LysX [Pyrolobus fumarii]AEM38625.1 lysine biosynthesis enzyme LysX [Pyrolobus fumarii 1A]
MTRVALAYDYLRQEEKLVIEALREVGLEVKMLPVTEKPFHIGGEPDIDLVVVRTTSMFNGLYTAAAYESMGIRSINQSRTILYSGDKALTYSLLARAKIPTPDTYIALGSRAVFEAAKLLGYPLVDKPPIGSWGRLVSLIYDDFNLVTVVEHREALCNRQMRIHVMQEYVETGNKDIRCLVLGGELLGCIYRIAREGEWRSNVALGGHTEVVDVTPDLENLVLRAAAVVEGDFVSIDVFEHPEKGYVVNEVNGIPEFKGFMRATGVNVARKLAEYVKSLVKA